MATNLASFLRSTEVHPQPGSHPSQPRGLPLLLMFHGGGHCVDDPESERPLPRLLVTAYKIICIAPSYRLAPESPFPASINDAWDTLQWAAAACNPSSLPGPPGSPLALADPDLGFIVGGTSSGANLAASLAHIARDEGLSLGLTGQFLSAGTYIHPDHVPQRYQSQYLSWEQNKSAPILDRHLYSIFREAFKPDPRVNCGRAFVIVRGMEG